MVEGKIDVSKVRLATDGSSRTGLLNVAVFGFDSGGNPMGVQTQELPLNFSEKEFARALKGGFRYALSFPAIRGTQNVRFAVSALGPDLVGRADTRLF